MKIKKIKAIKGYKSFADFEWQKFCKEKCKTESVFGKFTVVFGENGSGKSSICTILKSVSENQDFQNIRPTLAEIEINDGSDNLIHKYENGKWTSQVNKNSFLFFDVDFINANVHTHGERSNDLQRGGHTQNGGKLIIDLDEQANNLKVAIQEKKNELETLRNSYADILEKKFSDKKDEQFFQTYKDTDGETKQTKLSETEEDLKKLEADLATLQKLNAKYSEINRLSTVGQIVFSNPLSKKETFTELFTRQIKEKAQDQADEAIKTHFAKHKPFIEQAKNQIPENYTDENCPLCMQPLANAAKVIEYYRTAFDKTYENAKEQFLSDIKTAKDELQAIKTSITSLPPAITAVFDKLEKIKTDFEIQDIYRLEEKSEQTGKFSSISIKEIDDLLSALEALKKIDREQIDAEKLYNAVVAVIQEIEKSVENVNDLIKRINQSTPLRVGILTKAR